MSLIEQIMRLIENSPDLFDGLKEEHREAFMNWLPNNTHVVTAFGKYAKQLKQKGNREYYSAYCIRERLRWDSMVSEVGTEYKISNNNTPFISRLIMRMDPELRGMFRTKCSDHGSLESESPA